MIEALRAERTTGSRPDDRDGSHYVRSFLIMRLVVGTLGILLPLWLVFGDGWGFSSGGDPFPRDSLSAYYYSGVRELFVGTLCATGVFLITYKIADRGLDNTLSIVAGTAAIVVALCPTGRSKHDGEYDPTPLQSAWGEEHVQWIHFGAAAVFIVLLGVITYFFGVREGNRPARPGNRSPAFWRRFHWACTAVIGAAVAWVVATWIFGGPRWALLAGEWIAVWAFGASWWMKGAEWDVLFDRKPPGTAGEAA